MVARIERVDISGLAAVMDFLDEVFDTLEKPTEGLERGTQALAAQWLRNFQSEGGEYRRWKALAQTTQEDRARKGYGAQGPILQREGTLMSTAIEFFMETQQGSASGDGIHARYAIDGQTASLWMGGRKALNQTGRGRLPARPFWYSEGRAKTAVREATERWLEETFNK